MCPKISLKWDNFSSYLFPPTLQCNVALQVIYLIIIKDYWCPINFYSACVLNFKRLKHVYRTPIYKDSFYLRLPIQTPNKKISPRGDFFVWCLYRQSQIKAIFIYWCPVNVFKSFKIQNTSRIKIYRTPIIFNDYQIYYLKCNVALQCRWK